MNKVRIAYSASFNSKIGAEDLSTKLLSIGINASLTSYATQGAEIFLKENIADVVAVPLEAFPIEYDKQSVVIAGLSERNMPGYSLIIKEDAFDKGYDFKLKDGSKILLNQRLVGTQIKSINPTLEIIESKDNDLDIFRNFQQLDADALLMPQQDAIEAIKAEGNMHLVHLNPREIVPQGGSGVVAWIIHNENIELKKQLSLFHNREIALVTNIERSALKLANEQGIFDICAYCYMDQNHFYHLTIVMSDKVFVKQTFSQSTSSNLAQYAIQTLTH